MSAPRCTLAAAFAPPPAPPRSTRTAGAKSIVATHSAAPAAQASECHAPLATRAPLTVAAVAHAGTRTRSVAGAAAAAASRASVMFATSPKGYSVSIVTLPRPARATLSGR